MTYVLVEQGSTQQKYIETGLIIFVSLTKKKVAHEGHEGHEGSACLQNNFDYLCRRL